jgi:Nucleotide modification associated domain 3
MRIIFSRKGFDSSSGGGPSPIVDGRPISLPVPAVPNSSQHSLTRYADVCLGDQVERMSNGHITANHYCHHDPFFSNGGLCAFGQEASAQGHLANQAIGKGDVFLFFGLFADVEKRNPHHRIFGYLKIDDIRYPGAYPRLEYAPDFAPAHPHYTVQDQTKKGYSANNAVYLGQGQAARTAHDALRLTATGPENPNRMVSLWRVPTWLKQVGLTYHGADWRWRMAGNTQLLRTVGRGQEFVADIGKDATARAWVDDIIAHIVAG